MRFRRKSSESQSTSSASQRAGRKKVRALSPQSQPRTPLLFCSPIGSTRESSTQDRSRSVPALSPLHLSYDVDSASISKLASWQLALAPFPADWDDQLHNGVTKAWRQRREKFRGQVGGFGDERAGLDDADLDGEAMDVDPATLDGQPIDVDGETIDEETMLAEEEEDIKPALPASFHAPSKHLVKVVRPSALSLALNLRCPQFRRPPTLHHCPRLHLTTCAPQQHHLRLLPEISSRASTTISRPLPGLLSRRLRALASVFLLPRVHDVRRPRRVAIRFRVPRRT